MISVALRGVEGEDIKNTDEASKAEQRMRSVFTTEPHGVQAKLLTQHRGLTPSRNFYIREGEMFPLDTHSPFVGL